MKISAKDWRAIRDYAEAHHLKPQLSVPSVGIFDFTDPTGKRVTVGLTTIQNWYKDMKGKDKQA